MQNFKIGFLLILFISINLFADNITLDFEGLKNNEAIKNFYNGGSGSDGSSKGLDYNITFSAEALALIDQDAGGGGNFANEPSPSTTMYFLSNEDKIYMNVEGGFTEGFSFYYTSIHEEGDVEVWTDYNGTGKKIGSLHLDITPSLGKGDPNGEYDNWVKKSLSFDGRAKSIVFKGVANQIGFDNISLNPRSEQTIMDSISISPIGEETDTEALSHGKCNMSNEFLITLKFKTNNDLTNICDDFDFEIIGDKGGATLSDCGGKLKKCDIDKTWHLIDKNEYKLSLNFKINKIKNGYYFENGKLKVSKRSDDKSATVEIWKNFNAYGTGFDIKKDAFSFQNGTWNQSEKKYYKDILIYRNNIGQASDIISDYLKADQIEDFYNSVGWSKKILVKGFLWGYNEILNFHRNSQGLCYGMALASIANYKYKGQNDMAWKTTTLDNFDKEIKEHWDIKNNQISKQPKPYITDNIYTYKNNDIDALKKIMYYFVAQPFFKNKLWTGKEEDILIYTDKEKGIYNEYSKYMGINDTPLALGFSGLFGKNKGGHRVVMTQDIYYNKKEFVTIYDNNKPNEYSYMYFNNNKLTKNNLGVTKVYDMYISDPNNDAMNIYASSKKQQKMKRYQKIETRKIEAKKELAYNFPNHIKVYMVGGVFKNVMLKDSNKTVALYPITEKPKKDKAYKSEENIFTNVLFLPANKQYQIIAQKQENFATIKFFVTIPKKDGTVEYLVYNHAEVSKKDPTIMNFVVGVDNNNTSIKRDGASDYKADAKHIYKLKLSSVGSLNAIVANNSVNLSWNNPINPNYKESVVVRKENSKPTSITDGTEIYRGSDEEFIDTTIENNKKYYYAVYAISKDGNPTQPEIVFIDTYKYTLYGTATDDSGNAIEGATVTLYNGKKTKVIDTAYTSKTGLFAFNNLLDGEYVVSFSHPTFKFENSELNVTVENKSKEVLVKGEGVARLAMDIPQVVKVGETQNIIWDGVHIDDSATVDIKLLHNKKWETVASNVPYGKHVYKWKPKNSDNNATLKVSIDDKTYSEKKIIVLKNDKIMSNDNNVNNIDKNSTIPAGGGGGCSYNPQAKSFDAIMMFMLLFSLLYPFRNLFNIRKR